MSKKLPSQSPSNKTDISQFLDNASQLPQRLDSKERSKGRIIFALDATASRQPSWDRACHLQGNMFMATRTIGGLEVKLSYFCGFNEFYTTPWLNNGDALLKFMRKVDCVGGYTQITKVLNQCIKEAKLSKVNALIYIGDAIEEPIDTLCAKAGELGMLGVPLFMFQEGGDPAVKHGFVQMAKLSRGAYFPFDEHSAQEIADILSAIARFASGGTDALKQVKSGAAMQLLQQLKN